MILDDTYNIEIMSTTIRNGKLFCLNCGESADMPVPMEISMAGQKMQDFSDKHESCEKVWKEPEADMSLSEQERANWWLTYGEQGTSSLTMFVAIWGELITERECQSLLKNRPGHPYDPDDFSRCYKLLKAIPEGKGKLHLVSAISPEWSNLIANWDKLTEMYEDLIKNKKSNGMYKFMQSLI